MSELEQKLREIGTQAEAELAAATDLATVEQLRIKYLGRKGALTAALDQLGKLPKDEKPRVGKLANDIKNRITALLDEKKSALETAATTEKIDVTLPGRRHRLGHKHPLTQVTDEIVRIFRRMGFAVADGPEIETEYNNFDALNTPADHPARDLQDTFYVRQSSNPRESLLLRTHTSPVQIRTMLKQKPPVRIVCPGAVYRRDNPDATHAANFHQVEGLYVDKNVSVAHLKGETEYFFKQLLGPETKVRFRPHFFPFTEPSYEIDFSSPHLAAKGKEWLEIAGCGMVHPNVFLAVGYDPEQFTGYAFGLGVERIAMILYGIDDIRLFTENDVRFLEQF
jgi:phenylalanyl-tRNA synthetase alpha chain